MDTASSAGILSALGTGLPLLIASFLTALVVFGAGFGGYLMLTPYAELRLMREGTVAAGVTFAGAVLAFSIPIASTLANHLALTDVLVWGLVAAALQLLTTLVIIRVLTGVKGMIEANNVAVALGIAATQVAVGLLNAALMAS
jgi:putative membrane protein